MMVEFHSTFTCSFCGLVLPEQPRGLGSCPSSRKDSALSGQPWSLGRGPAQGHFSAAVLAAVRTCSELVFSSLKLFQIYSAKH